MEESPQEVLDQAEHASHTVHDTNPFISTVSITIALLAVAAATVGSLESLETAVTLGEKNAAALSQNKATDQWGFFQAKSIKKNLYDIAAASGGPQAEAFKAAAKRNEDDSRKIQAEATSLEAEVASRLDASEVHERRHQVLTVAVTFLHVSIAIATISIIMRGKKWPWYSAMGAGVIGAALAAFAYL